MTEKEQEILDNLTKAILSLNQNPVWEYKEVNMDCTTDEITYHYMGSLKAAGLEGWELVTIIPSSNNRTAAILKRKML